MAELTPIPSAQRPSDPGYQPVSGYAVAAGVTAGFFAIILVVLVIIAVTSRRTPFSYELLALPVIGIILAAIGRSHVRNSEGTRTGMRLATTAWWVCVLGGAGFAAYMYANELVLERESARFADKFFDELKAGRPTYAFLYLLPPEERDRADPGSPEVFESTYAMGGYAAYKNHDLVRLMMRNGSAVELERTGVKDLGQESAGFQATHLYRLTCPEGVFDVQVKLVAPESRTGRRPEWFIPGQPVPNFSLQVNRLSTYGRLVAELEQEGDAVAKLWMLHLASGRVTFSQLMTADRTHREPYEKAMGHAQLFGGGPGSVFPFGAAFLSNPGDRKIEPATNLAGQARLAFDDLAARGFFHRDSTGAEQTSDRLTKMRELWVPPRLTPAAASRQMNMAQIQSDVPVVRFAPDRVTVVVAAELGLESQLHFARCAIGVNCDRPEVLAALKEARDGGPNNETVVSLRSLPSRDWRIAWLRTDMEPHSVITGPDTVSAEMPRR